MAKPSNHQCWRRWYVPVAIEKKNKDTLNSFCLILYLVMVVVGLFFILFVPRYVVFEHLLHSVLAYVCLQNVFLPGEIYKWLLSTRFSLREFLVLTLWRSPGRLIPCMDLQMPISISWTSDWNGNVSSLTLFSYGQGNLFESMFFFHF